MPLLLIKVAVEAFTLGGEVVTADEVNNEPGVDNKTSSSPKVNDVFLSSFHSGPCTKEESDM